MREHTKLSKPRVRRFSTSRSLTPELVEPNDIQVAKTTLQSLLQSQLSFGSTMELAICFYITSFFYSIMGISNAYGNRQVPISFLNSYFRGTQAFAYFGIQVHLHRPSFWHFLDDHRTRRRYCCDTSGRQNPSAWEAATANLDGAINGGSAPRIPPKRRRSSVSQAISS